MAKEIEINMVLEVPDTEDADSICDKFLEWVDDNKWTCGGGVKDITNDEFDNEIEKASE